MYLGAGVKVLYDRHISVKRRYNEVCVCDTGFLVILLRSIVV